MFSITGQATQFPAWLLAPTCCLCVAISYLAAKFWAISVGFRDNITWILICISRNIWRIQWHCFTDKQQKSISRLAAAFCWGSGNNKPGRAEVEGFIKKAPFQLASMGCGSTHFTLESSKPSGSSTAGIRAQEKQNFTISWKDDH